MNPANQDTPPVLREGDHYRHASFGSLEEVAQRQFAGIGGKLFLKEALGLSSMEVSVNVMQPGQGMPFLHSHRQNQELYVFLSGSGQFMVGESVFNVGPGSCVRVDPAGVRCWRSTGNEPLHFLCIQSPAGGLSSQFLEDGVGAGRPHWNRPTQEETEA